MTMVTKCQGCAEIVGQRLEAAEVRGPASFIQFESNAISPTHIEETRYRERKFGGLNDIVELVAERQDLRVGPVLRHRSPSRAEGRSSASEQTCCRKT